MDNDSLFSVIDAPSARAATDTSFIELESKSAGFPYEVTRDYSTQEEPSFYKNYKEQYLQNPFAALLTDYLVDALAGNYEIVPGTKGSDSDVEKVNDFFYFNGTRQQLKELTIQAVLFGNGFGQLEVKGGSLQIPTEYDPSKPAFKRIDAETVVIERDENGKETFVQRVGGKETNLKRERMLVMRFKRLPHTPYGISFMRPSLHTLSALQELIRDVPAAIKNFAYIHRLAKLDLDGYDSVTEKNQVIDDFRKKFNRVDPANSGIIVLDKSHDVGYMANVGGQGGSQTRIMPIMDLIEPLLSSAMLNFLMALGHIQQTGANKSIIEAQEVRVKEQLDTLRREWARVVDLELLQYIVGGPQKVSIRHIPSNFELLQERGVLVQEFLAGVISREFYLERAKLDDRGTTFKQEPQAQDSQNSKSNTEKGSE